MERFDIVIEGFEPGFEQDAPAALAKAFGIEQGQAAQIVQSTPVTVKRDVDMNTAERYFHALRDIGAKIRMDRRPAANVATSEPAQAPPDAGAPVAAAASAGAAATAAAPPAAAQAAAAPADEAGGAGPYREPDAPPLESRGPFMPALAGAFAYPLQKSAPLLFVAIAVVAQLVSYVPLVGGILKSGVLLGFFVSVLRSSAKGEQELPYGGEFSEGADFIRPILQYASAFALSFAPAVLVLFVLPWGTPAFFLALAAATLLGIAYLPAALILAAHSGGCFSMNPVAGVQMIARVPGAYTLTAFGVGVAVLMDVALVSGVQLAVSQLPLPVLPGALVILVGLYMPTVAARMLGLFIFYHEPELGV
jgi:hypothetical protein